MVTQEDRIKARNIIAKYASKYTIPSDFESQLKNAVTDLGILNDGSDTQDELNTIPSYSFTYFPSGTYALRGFDETAATENELFNGFNLKENQVFIFDDGAILKPLPNNSIGYAVVHIQNGTNNVMIHPQIKGDRTEHDYSYNPVAEKIFGDRADWYGISHELGHGIYLGGSGGCDFYQPEIEDMPGDCMDTRGEEGSRIRVYGGYFARARRNNLSIESMDTFYIEGTEIYGAGGTLDDPAVNIEGTPPKAGIDIEPHNNDHILTDIHFKNLNVHTNYDGGLKSYYMYDATVEKILMEDCTFDGVKLISTAFPGEHTYPNDDSRFILRNTRITDGAYGICLEAAAPNVRFEGKTLIDIQDRTRGEVKKVRHAIELRKPVWENEWYAEVKPGHIYVEDVEILDNTSTDIFEVGLTSNIHSEYNMNGHFEPYGFEHATINIKKSNAKKGPIDIDYEPKGITFDGVNITSI